MMNEVEWNERFNIGVDSIDKAHKRLFSIVRKIIDLNEDPEKRRWVCEEGIKYFKSYTIRHFADEEKYMQSISYEGYEIHKHLHDEMRDVTIPALERHLDEFDYSVEAVQHFIGICVGWLTGHIMIEDHAITGRVAKKWVYDHSEEEISVLRKAFTQVMQNAFKVDTNLVSAHYSGADFGKGVYYRLTYQSVEKERLQVILALEEYQVIRLISDVLGIQLNRMDKIVYDAVRQILQQFMKRIAIYLHVTGTYKLEKENILTEDQFHMEFHTGYPQYSLLFDTGIGYFVFCIKSSDNI